MDKKIKVIVIGGGVAGMSAAHELIERGFDVEVFERKAKLPGGKARSVPVPDPDAPPHTNPLPGEHGFRFFPGFYKHVTDTMKRIPFPPKIPDSKEEKADWEKQYKNISKNKNGVYDNLVAAPHVMMARLTAEEGGKKKKFKPIVMLDSFPKSFSDFKFLLNSLHQDTGLSSHDKEFFAGKVWQLMTSCHERRANDYERMGWWQFTDAADQSDAYQDLLAKGLTRTLVAARSKTASAKTGGDIFLQLIFNMANPAIASDRILDGPTNDKWLHPWFMYLKSKGVKYHFNSLVKSIDCVKENNTERAKIAGIHVSKTKINPTGQPTYNDTGKEVFEPPVKHTADYYICAVPVEVAARLFLSDVLPLDMKPYPFMGDHLQQPNFPQEGTTVFNILKEAIIKENILKPGMDADKELTRAIQDFETKKVSPVLVDMFSPGISLKDYLKGAILQANILEDTIQLAATRDDVSNPNNDPHLRHEFLTGFLAKIFYDSGIMKDNMTAVELLKDATMMSEIVKPGISLEQLLKDAVLNAKIFRPGILKPGESLDFLLNEAKSNAAILEADPTLAGVIELAQDVSWMTGVQYYLNEVVNLNDGHIIFSDSPWAITAISQVQFWKDVDMSKFADGQVKSILSVDVSEWDTVGLNGKIAKDCSAEEIRHEVWAQMKAGLNYDDNNPMLRDEMIHTWFIDRDIKFEGDYASKNQEPLLVNKINTWCLRPESHTDIPNFFLAADYVRTYTDLATMEGANEAARRAVNDIIDASGVDQPLCKIWDLHEPTLLAYYRWCDLQRYRKGLPWKEKFPWFIRLLHSIMILFRKIF